MTGPVKPVAPHPELAPPLVRHSVSSCRLVHLPVRTGLDKRNQRNPRQLLPKGLNRSNIGRIVGRRQERKLLHRPEKCLIDNLRLIQPTGVNRLESHRVDLGQILQRFSRSGNRRNALANRRRIVGALPVRLPDPFHPPLGQHRLLRHLQNLVLERRATDIWDKTFHLLAVIE